MIRVSITYGHTTRHYCFGDSHTGMQSRVGALDYMLSDALQSEPEETYSEDACNYPRGMLHYLQGLCITEIRKEKRKALPVVRNGQCEGCKQSVFACSCKGGAT